MRISFQQNCMAPVDGMRKISALTWSSNGKRLAISTPERIVYLYDDQGQKQDKFPTKSGKDSQSYVIRAMEFSPDSQRIALGQSDDIVFVYKLGENWGDKKSICNKFPASSSVTCLAWPKQRPNELVFGLADGKIKQGILRSNKSTALYSTESYCVSMAASKDGESIVSGHLDGSIYAYNLETQGVSKVVVHHSIPYALEWGHQIVAGGNDQKISFYDIQGSLLQRFDYTKDDKVKEFTLARFNPSGDTVVIGNFNRFYTYHYNSKRQTWEDIGVQNIDNYYTVTSLCWKNDGSKLVSGSLCGSVDMYNVSMKTIKYKGKFELNYVSPSQIVVKVLQNNSKIVIRSSHSDINKINIFQDRYVVAHTAETILFGDLEIDKTSEIPWSGSGKEKYDFSNPNVCMIFNFGELTLIEYGNNEPLGTCRTEHMKSNLLSCRLNYSGPNPADGNKVIAYLLDLQTICIKDLKNNIQHKDINHDSKIDYIELNSHANKLLFRDKRKQLYLYNIKTQTKSTLLSYCSYAQWVPKSEVVVAQNRQNLCVWYSIEYPDKVTIYNIKGDVEKVQRTNDSTEVIVNDGNSNESYSLDEPLIEFGFAVESQDLERAAQILDPLEMNPETEANWKTLATLAIEQQNISVAEHCYASLGDISKATYLRKVHKLIVQYEKETQKNGIEYYMVQAKLALLEKQFHRAEQLLLDHSKIDDAMDMYQELHKWDDLIKMAENKRHPDLQMFKDNYHNWLLETNQEEKLGEVKEQEGDFLTAISLYLKSSLPTRAANVVFNYDIEYSSEILLQIAQQLEQAGMFEKAGEFYENLDNTRKALDNYCKGNAFGKAVDLARAQEPRSVAQYEEMWGDYLVKMKQNESAVNHYIEAQSTQKAIEAAIAARQWTKAQQLLQHQSEEVSRPYYRQIALHYAEVRQYDFAERQFLRAKLPVEAFEMYAKQSKWDHALRVAQANLSEQEIVSLYVKQAEKFEQQQMYKEAEKLYTDIKVFDLAINMYKKAELFEQMIRLVAKHRPDMLKDTHLLVAERFKGKGSYKQAEQHYIESGAWSEAVVMYKQKFMWEEAVHVCKMYGDDKETCELAKQWAETLGREEANEIFKKHHLMDAMIEYLCDKNEFEEAFKTAKQNAMHKIPDVHLKKAYYLEDGRRYKEAEENFIKAGQPEEAIYMYEHLNDFVSALQVARQYKPENAPKIYLSQAKGYIQQGDYQKAEAAYLNARKPEDAVQMYIDVQNFAEAQRVALRYRPNLIDHVNRSQAGGGQYTADLQQNQGNMAPDELFRMAQVQEQNRNYVQAIDSYLNLTKQTCNDTQLLKNAWQKACTLARSFDTGRYRQITNTVANRFLEIQEYEAAGQVFEQIQMYKEAINSLLKGQHINKAKQVAYQVRNDQQLANELNKMISAHEIQDSRQRGDAYEIIRNGQVDEGLKMLMAQNQWKEALDAADQYGGGERLGQVLIKFAKITIEEGKFAEAIQAFDQYGMQPIVQNYPIYKVLILEIFFDCDEKEISHLRNALFNFYKLLEGTGDHQSQAGLQFYKYLQIAHILNLKSIYKKKDSHSLFTAVSVSSLRYSDSVRVDKLHYDAGTALQSSNKGFAQMVLNRYLDIYQVVNNPDAEVEEAQEFQMSDIPHANTFQIPQSNIIDNRQQEKIKEWLLNILDDNSIQEDLPTVQCDNCGQQKYEAGLRCIKCNFEYQPCIISGYPCRKNQINNCRSCGKSGLKEYWSQYLQHFTNCPWCGQLPN